MPSGVKPRCGGVRLRSLLFTSNLGVDNRRNLQAGSLTGAVHLSNGNAGVLRAARGGQKPPVEQKGKCCLDHEIHCRSRDHESGAYRSFRHRPSDLTREVPEKLPQG